MTTSGTQHAIEAIQTVSARSGRSTGKEKVPESPQPEEDEPPIQFNGIPCETQEDLRYLKDYVTS